MIPLAVSGPIFLAGVIALAVLSLWWLLRNEARETAEDPGEDGEDPPR